VRPEAAEAHYAIALAAGAAGEPVRALSGVRRAPDWEVGLPEAITARETTGVPPGSGLSSATECA
jgi:hypothetical protein